MQSLIADTISALSNAYSGWIFWNLFLAFIPLVLSFVLFRRKNVSKSWLGWFSGIVVVIGLIGFLPKLPRVLGMAVGRLQQAFAGDTSALMSLVWLGAIALIALGLSLFLFKRKQNLRSAGWWLGLVVFIAFLPNAPYLLTDIIHLVRATSSGLISPWVIVSVVIPIHVAAILLGMEAYVLSLMNQGYYLKHHGAKQYIFLGELIVHALCAIGVYLGRFIRFNSWDLVTDPGNVLLTTFDTLTAKRPVFVIIVIFVVLTVLYWMMKQLTIGIQMRWRAAQLGDDGLG
jgi:LPXTG-motif cell wall-anchored protein